MPVANCNFYLLDMHVTNGQLDLCPLTIPQRSALRDNRLACLRETATWVQQQHAAHYPANKLIIVAPESFFGIFCYDAIGSPAQTMLSDQLENAIASVKHAHPGIIFAPGTFIRRKNGKAISISSVGRSSPNGPDVTVIKGAQGGQVDFAEGSPWDTTWTQGHQKVVLQVGGQPQTFQVALGGAEWSKIYREPGGFSFGSIVCTDARNLPLHCDPNIGIRGADAKVPLVVWMTFKLFLTGAAQGFNFIDPELFPLGPGGVLVQCGAGDNHPNENAWTAPAQANPAQHQQGTLTLAHAGCERMMVRTRQANAAFTNETPDGWFTLSPATVGHIKKVVYWTDIPVQY